MAERGHQTSRDSDLPPVWTSISLRRSGQKPLRFDGALMLEATMAASEQRLGHAVRLFETLDGQIAVAMELWTFGCDVPTAAASIVRTPEDVVEACENFDPVQRVSMDVSRALSAGPGEALAARLAIDSRLEATEADYRSTVLSILRHPRA